VFFDLENEGTVNSTIYRDQILKGPLMKFWENVFGDIQELIVMEDNASIHKKVCIPIRQELGMRCYQHPSNSSDLNSIENIWAHMKHRISTECGHITSVKAMKHAVISI